MNPGETREQLLRKYKNSAFYPVDVCQSVAERDVNVQEIHCQIAAMLEIHDPANSNVKC